MADAKNVETIRFVYRRWRRSRQLDVLEHPDEQELIAYLDHAMAEADVTRMKAHLMQCDRCADAVAATLGVGSVPLQPVPRECLDRVMELAAFRDKRVMLEIVLRARKTCLELIHATGDMQIGMEVVPASVLRSRQLHEFEREVSVFKDYETARVKVCVEKQGVQKFKVVVSIHCKDSQKCIRDARITLLRESIELESYHAVSGRAAFERIPAGEYVIEVASLEEKLAVILLEIQE